MPALVAIVIGTISFSSFLYAAVSTWELGLYWVSTVCLGFIFLNVIIVKAIITEDLF